MGVRYCTWPPLSQGPIILIAISELHSIQAFSVCRLEHCSLPAGLGIECVGQEWAQAVVNQVWPFVYLLQDVLIVRDLVWLQSLNLEFLALSDKQLFSCHFSRSVDLKVEPASESS